MWIRWFHTFDHIRLELFVFVARFIFYPTIVRVDLVALASPPSVFTRIPYDRTLYGAGNIFHKPIVFLPTRPFAHIILGNATTTPPTVFFIFFGWWRRR